MNDLIGSKFLKFNDNNYGFVHPYCCGPESASASARNLNSCVLAWVRTVFARTRRVHS